MNVTNNGNIEIKKDKLKSEIRVKGNSSTAGFNNQCI